MGLSLGSVQSAIRGRVEDTADRLKVGESVRTWTRAKANVLYDPRATAKVVWQSTKDATKLAPRAAAAYATMGASEVPTVIGAAASYDKRAGAAAVIAGQAAAAYTGNTQLATASKAAGEDMGLNLGKIGGVVSGALDAYGAEGKIDWAKTSSQTVKALTSDAGSKGSKSKAAAASAGAAAERLTAGAPASGAVPAGVPVGVLLVGAALVVLVLLRGR